MVTLDILKGKTVFLDTAPLIYFIEENNDFAKPLEGFFELNRDGVLFINTSVLTLLEVLVLPFKSNNLTLVSEYQTIFSESKNFAVKNLEFSSAISAAALRANYNLSTPDSIQVAIAIENKSDYFFTNDEKLKRVKEVEVLTLSDFG